MFQSPSPTRYDLRFTLFGIPVRVHPLFWVIAALLGSTSNDIVEILTWVAAVFISVLIHELGHALVMRYYGISSNIILHFSGGLTVPESMRWGNGVASMAPAPGQEIVISLAGPFSGFAFAVFVIVSVTLSGGSILMGSLFGVIPLPAAADLPFGGDILTSFVLNLLWVNIFWGVFNLMPVYPLDGGNVTRYALIKSDPWDGARKSLWVSVIAGGALAIVGLVAFRSMYMAFLFAFLAFQSYQTLRGSAGRF